MQWYYSKNGSQLGPVEQGELLTKISTGDIAPTDMAWREGMADWLPVSKVNELAMSPRPMPQLAPSQSEISSTPQSPYTPPVTINTTAPVTIAPQGSGKATASMVLGILGLVFAICGCYGILVALPCSIIAIVLGGQFKKEAALNPALMGEFGKAKAGVIMGWIAVGIIVLLNVIMLSLGMVSQMFGGGALLK